MGVFALSLVLLLFFTSPAKVFASSTGTVTVTIQVRPPKSEFGFRAVLKNLRESIGVAPGSFLWLINDTSRVVMHDQND